MSEQESPRFYLDEQYLNYLPKKYIKIKQACSNGKSKVQSIKADRESSSSIDRVKNVQQIKPSQSGQDTNQCEQVNIRPLLLLREHYKSNPNSPYRKVSIDSYDRMVRKSESHFYQREQKQMKESKHERYQQNIWLAMKNFQTISFDSSLQICKIEKSIQTPTQQCDEDNKISSTTISTSSSQRTPSKKRQIFRSVFANQQQTGKTPQDEYKKSSRELQEGLVINNIKPRMIFTNATLVKLKKSIDNQTHSVDKQIPPSNKVRILKNSTSTRPSSSSSSSSCAYKNRNNSYRIDTSKEMIPNSIISDLIVHTTTNTFALTDNTNLTPSRDLMRATNISFYSGHQNNQKLLLESTRNSRPKTAGASRSPDKRQLSTQNQNVNILYQRLNSANQRTLHIELDQEFQTLGKSPLILSTPSNIKCEGQEQNNNIQSGQDKRNNIKFKQQVGIPIFKNTNIFNHKNAFKITQTPLSEKCNPLQINSFFFPSPLKRAPPV